MMIALVAALLLASTPSWGQDLPKPELTARIAQIDVSARELGFPSGLTVILQQDKQARFLSVATVHTGVPDPEGKHATGHLTDHLVYDATLGSGTVADRLYAEGVDYDSQVLLDWTMYRKSGPAAALRTILEAEGLRLSDPLAGVGQEQLDAAKQILGLEKYYKDRGSWTFAMGPLANNLYPEGHPWAARHLELEQVEFPAVTLDDVRAWAAKAYLPAETTIVISGPIDFDETVSALFYALPARVMHPGATDANFKTFVKPGVVNPDPNNPDHLTRWLADPQTDKLIDLAPAPRERIKRLGGPVEPYPRNAAYDGETVHIDGLVETPMAVAAWPLPGNYVGQDAMKWMGTTAIGYAGNGDWNSVFEIARGPTGGAVAGCSNIVGVSGGLLVCTAQSRDSRVDADLLTGRLLAPASVFWDPNATWLHEQATEGSRRSTLALTLHALEAHTHLTESIAARTALSTHFADDPSFTAKFMSEVMSVDKHTVRPWVQQWLPEARAVTVVIDPIPKDRWLNLAPNGTTWHAALTGHSIPPTDTPPTDEQVAAAWAGPDLSKAVSKRLSNGLEVVVVPYGSVPVVVAALASRGGATAEGGLATLADLTMYRIFDEIWSDPTGMKQELLPDKIGGDAFFAQMLDVTYEGFAVPTDNLDGALYLMRRNDMARKVIDLRRTTWWRSTKLELPRSWANRSWWAQQERMSRILPGHPVTWSMTREDALRLKDDVTNADLLAFHARKFNLDNSTLVMVGRVDPEKAFTLAETYWGSWKPTGKGTPPAVPRPEPKGPATLFYDADGATHTVVSAACPLPAPTAEASAAQRVLASLLQDAYEAKLAEAGAEALAGQVSGREGSGVAWLELVAVVPHGKGAQAVEATQATLALPAARSLDPGRVQQHKLRAASAEFGAATSTRAMIQAATEAWILPFRGKDWYARWSAALPGVDLDDLASAATGCAENAVITVEAPAADLASIPGAERVDWLALGDAELEAWDKGAYKRLLKQRAKAAAP